MRVIVASPALVEQCTECGIHVRRVVELGDKPFCPSCVLRAAKLAIGIYEGIYD